MRKATSSGCDRLNSALTSEEGSAYFTPMRTPNHTKESTAPTPSPEILPPLKEIPCLNCQEEKIHECPEDKKINSRKSTNLNINEQVTISITKPAGWGGQEEDRGGGERQEKAPAPRNSLQRKRKKTDNPPNKITIYGENLRESTETIYDTTPGYCDKIQRERNDKNKRDERETRKVCSKRKITTRH